MTMAPDAIRSRDAGPLGPGVERVHLVGIGGAGMEALARLLAGAGYRVSGSDAVDGPVVADLRRQGIPVFPGHSAEHVRGADLLVYSSAVRADNAERLAARLAGIPQRRRADALGQLTQHLDAYAVAGTHGKTTTASLLARVLQEAGREPSVAIGGWVDGRTQAVRGAGDCLVVEADEYDRSFLQLTPQLAIVTNVEAEHIDTYADEEAVIDAFAEFLGRTRADGCIVVNGDDPGCRRALAACGRAGVLTFGFSAGCDLRGDEPRLHGGGTQLTWRIEGRQAAATLLLPGRHNAANALAVCAAAHRLQVDPEALRRGLEGFGGVDRRFQHRGVHRGVTVVDDYAHHPTEIAAALATARERAAGGRLLAVWQPHTYSRTRRFRADFVHALTGADQTWVTDVYAAREVADDGDTAEGIVADLRATGGAATYAGSAADAVAEALAAAREGDWLLVMGAGDVGDRLVEILGEGA